MQPILSILAGAALVTVLSGCGGMLEHTKQAVHHFVEAGFAVYEDAKENVKAVKKMASGETAEPAKSQ
jgi:hypothetical protein